MMSAVLSNPGHPEIRCGNDSIPHSPWPIHILHGLVGGVGDAEGCAKSAWSVRQLERQIHTMYYQRILASQDNRKLGVDMLGKTKTRSGERTIVLPRSTAEILRRRKENAITQWIFPDPVRPELPLSPNCAYTHMKAILHKAGLPDIRFHDLRHTFATHAIASGVDAKTLSGILGHTNASFTLDTYTHVTPDMQKAASGIVGGFMEDLLGKGLRPWQRNGKAEPAP